MLPLPLSLGRITCRLDIAPKSLAYFARRETFGAKYYPAQYADWELGPTTLRLIDHKGERRMVLDPDFIAVETEYVQDVPTFRKHALAAVRDYLESVTQGSEAKRFGWRLQVFTEHASFESLIHLVRAQIMDDNLSWWKLEGFGPPRDFAHTLFYGDESDGLNMVAGVFTAVQAQAFLGELKFKERKQPLAISEGALMLDLDRYAGPIHSREQMEHIAAEHSRMVKIAEQVAAKLLHELPG